MGNLPIVQANSTTNSDSRKDKSNISATLKRYNGIRTRTVMELGMHRSTLRREMKMLGINALLQ
ncbi:MAG: hypothetical protein GF315_08880 [candidate division Zixibacteria bacterium]|nr:hypothetical protein [candidate division Zixibacteria bacterium]